MGGAGRHLVGLILNPTGQKSGQYSRCGVFSVSNSQNRAGQDDDLFEEFLTTLQLPLDEEDFEEYLGTGNHLGTSIDRYRISII